MNEAVIVAAKRTAFGKYGGKLRHLEPELLLQPLFNYLKNNFAAIVSNIDDVILGNVVGNGGNIARKALLERSEEHTSELQSRFDLVCRLLLEKKKNKPINK